MSLKIIVLFASFFSSAFLIAQYDDLLRDPDITWVAEYTTDFVMNPENEDENLLPEVLNYFNLIRLQNADAENGLYGNSTQKYLSQRFLENVNLKNFSIYNDSLLHRLLTQEELFSTMTKIDTAHSNCGDGPQTWLIKNDVSDDQIWCFRVRQVFWYNQKMRTFGTRLLAYAPIVYTRDNEGNINGVRALFWVKADKNLPKHFNNKRFSYIFQTKMMTNAPRFEDFKVLKGDFDFRKFFSEEINTPSHPCFDTGYQPLNTTMFPFECFGTDTIVTFDYKTYKEQIQIKQRNCIEQIERIRFVQNWYYDERSHNLYIRLVGIAPLATVRDEVGELRYYKPLFYQMYR